MRIRQLDATFGAEITGIALADVAVGLEASAASSDRRRAGDAPVVAPVEDAWMAIEDAFHEHAVLVFPAQHLTSAQHLAFARRFGPLEKVAGVDGVIPISNQDRDGALLPLDSPTVEVLRGNEGWHTDSSYMPVSARASILAARVVPSTGGETQWADMRAAWDALDDTTRDLIRDRTAAHSIRYSQARLGYAPDRSGYGHDVETPPRRPLMKIHPVTGRPSLFIGRHAHEVSGMDSAESEALLERLVLDACQPPRVLTHRWAPGDVVVWDNRCVLHRARPYDPTEHRVMMHARVAGDPVTEAGV